MIRTGRIVVPLMFVIILLGACSTAPPSRADKDELIRRAAAALKEWNQDVPGLEGFARQSYAYAVFPDVAKGGLGFGAAYGRGVVYEQGAHAGYADVSHASLGLQVGGQAYQVLVVFDHSHAFERFKHGWLAFSADASGVVLATGYVAHVRFSEGFTVVAKPIGGVMGEASIGGQRFTFVRGDDTPRDQSAPPGSR